eukprot:TRINITY_DN13030_c0_g1::TRINITY_DN13030_c0_g1_i1::g.10701::m.10701 TRINITY_DN13030_c0_g1::TRINITY_DN13030_c0_g1_i1::g.10701  ORF type:complete len:115 (+),score=17.61 TRINITY_DN13030_c0_g1_i1:135-479(+)
MVIQKSKMNVVLLGVVVSSMVSSIVKCNRVESLGSTTDNSGVRKRETVRESGEMTKEITIAKLCKDVDSVGKSFLKKENDLTGVCPLGNQTSQPNIEQQVRQEYNARKQAGLRM